MVVAMSNSSQIVVVTTAWLNRAVTQMFVLAVIYSIWAAIQLAFVRYSIVFLQPVVNSVWINRLLLVPDLRVSSSEAQILLGRHLIPSFKHLHNLSLKLCLVVLPPPRSFCFTRCFSVCLPVSNFA